MGSLGSGGSVRGSASGSVGGSVAGNSDSAAGGQGRGSKKKKGKGSSSKGGGGGGERVVVYEGPLLECSISDLAPGELHDFRVQAMNSEGLGPYGSTVKVSALTTAPSQAHPPVLVKVREAERIRI